MLEDKVVNEVQKWRDVKSVDTLSCDESLCIAMCTNAIAIRTPIKLTGY